MKKISFFALMLALLIGCTNTGFAASSVAKASEIQAARLIVNGKAAPLQDKAIIQGNTVYLPLKLLAVNLGFKDDKTGIQVNSSRKTYKLVQGKSRLELALNSKKAVLNGKTITLANAPSLYKNAVYLPADNIAGLFGKKAVWDADAGSIAICDTASFNQTKSILDKAGKATDAAKYKGLMTMDMGMGKSVRTKTTNNVEADGPGKIEHSTTTTDTNGVKRYEESYKTGDFDYSRYSQTGDWTRTAAQKGSSGIVDLGSGLSDIVYAGLVSVKPQNPGDLVLEGDVELFSLSGDANTDKTFKTHTKITIDKSTNYIKEVSWISSGNTVISKAKYSYTYVISCKYTDYGGSFEVKLPEGLTDLAESKVYKNSELGVSMNYPADWEENTQYEGIEAAFLSPEESAADLFRENVTLATEDLAGQGITLEQYTEAGMAQIGKNYADYKLINSDEWTLDGLQAHMVVYSFTQDQYALMAFEVWTIKDEKAYILTYVAEPDKYDAFAPYVDGMLGTFRFE